MDFSISETAKIRMIDTLTSLFRGDSKDSALVYISPDLGGSDFIRVVSPFIKIPLLSAVSVYCIKDLFIDGALNNRRICSAFYRSHNVTFLVSRNKISISNVHELRRLQKKYSCSVIVDLDDDLFSMDSTHPQYEEYLPELDKLKELLGFANLLVASTPEVVQGVERVGVNIKSIVIPNCLDDRIWVWGERLSQSDDGPLRVLYSGTETHDADLKMLAEYMPSIVNSVYEATGRDLEVHVVGGTLLDLPGLIIHRVPPELRRYDLYVEWLCNLGTFDFAVAPLCLDNKMNHAKSNLKFLEYSALGLPCIYTNIEPYRRTVIHGLDGYLVDLNSKEGWIESFCSLSSDRCLRVKMGMAAEKKLKSYYLLSDHFEDWASLIN